MNRNRVPKIVGQDAKLGKAAARVSTRYGGDTSHTTRSNVYQGAPIPEAPFYGPKVIDDIDLDDVFAFVNETALFKGQWQYKQGRSSKEDYAELLKNTVYPKYEAIKEKAKREKLLEPKVVYGYFPCQSEGNDLIVYTNDLAGERLRFNFPRQPLDQRGGKNLCLADFFASRESGRMDTVAFQLVTMGRRASEYAMELFKSDNYTDYLLFHGLSVESAEALAEMWHKRIREELDFAGKDAPELAKLFHQGYQGSRYSFGYPACPNLEDQAKMFELIRRTRSALTLSEDSSSTRAATSAIIIHHPDAKYFNIE